MNSAPPDRPPPPVLAWWIFWGGITGGLVLVYSLLGHRPTPVADELPEFVAYLFTVPLLLSCAVRWVVLPRTSTRQKAFPLFIVGLALAESCGLLGIFLGGDHRDTLVACSFLGLIQFAPVFVGDFEH